MDERNPATTEQFKPVTLEEYKEGYRISLVVGLYYTLNAFVPIIAWYGSRRVAILAMQENTFYKLAWYSMYALHFFAFTPMAFIWPMTYTGVSVVIEFYDLANWYLGSVVAAFIYIYVALMWLLAIAMYKPTSVITKRSMFQEMLLYMLIEAFAWYTSVWEYSKAHNQFYFANKNLVTPKSKSQARPRQYARS